jgi:uncharacterized OB-fold protein
MSGLPATDEPESAPFWAAAREGRLLVQECDGVLRFPPHPGGSNVGWREVSGRGKVWSFIVVHPPTLPAFADKTPFPVAVVELDDAPGVRMVGNLIAAPGAPLNSLTGEAIDVGMPVKVCFERVAEDVALPCWTPA